MAKLALLFIRAAELGVLKQPLVREVSDEMAGRALPRSTPSSAAWCRRRTSRP